MSEKDYKSRYYLFTSEAHDDINLNFPEFKITEFIRMWSDGKTHDEMCRKLRVKPIELTLICMDLEYAGKLPARAGGLFGKRRSD